MSLTTVRNLIVSKLNAKTAKPVIQMEQVASKPPLPYMAYKIITAGNTEPGQPIMERTEVISTDPLFDYDIKETAIEQEQEAFSFCAYASTSVAAMELATIAKNFIKHNMYYDLKDAGAVVISIEAEGDRTVLIDPAYEYRYGFDVIVRMVNSADRIVSTIEEININLED